MVNYHREVESDAQMVISDHADEIAKIIVAGEDLDDNSQDFDFSQVVHESVTDRGYTLEDAAFVIDNCVNEESDSGLWDGAGDLREQISVMAAYSYSNDVQAEVSELFDEIKTEYEFRESDKNWEGTEDDEEAKEKLAAEIIDEYCNPKNKPVEKGSEDEKDLLVSWCKANDKAGFRGGYPLGQSYIDSRCGTGFGQPDQLDYINFDHEVAARVPHLKGKYRCDVLVYLAKEHETYLEGRHLGTTTKYRVDVRTRKAKYETDDEYRQIKNSLLYDTPKEAIERAQGYLKLSKSKTVKYRIVEVESREMVVEYVENSKKSST